MLHNYGYVNGKYSGTYNHAKKYFMSHNKMVDDDILLINMSWHSWKQLYKNSRSSCPMMFCRVSTYYRTVYLSVYSISFFVPPPPEKHQSCGSPRRGSSAWQILRQVQVLCQGHCVCTRQCHGSEVSARRCRVSVCDSGRSAGSILQGEGSGVLQQAGPDAG